MERRGRLFRRLSVGGGTSQRDVDRGDGGAARLRRREPGAGPRGCGHDPEAASRTRRSRHDARRDRPAVGPAQRLGAAAISRDRGPQSLRRAGPRARNRPIAGLRPMSAATPLLACSRRSTMSPARPMRARGSAAAANMRCRSGLAGPTACSPRSWPNIRTWRRRRNRKPAAERAGSRSPSPCAPASMRSGVAGSAPGSRPRECATSWSCETEGQGEGGLPLPKFTSRGATRCAAKRSPRRQHCELYAAFCVGATFGLRQTNGGEGPARA